MAHYGSLGDHRFAADVPHVRGADVYGSDHETMAIRFVVMEGGDSSQSHKFLFPVNRIFDDDKHGTLSLRICVATGSRSRAIARNVLMMEKQPAARPEPIEPGKALTTAVTEDHRGIRISSGAPWFCCLPSVGSAGCHRLAVEGIAIERFWTEVQVGGRKLFSLTKE